MNLACTKMKSEGFSQAACIRFINELSNRNVLNNQNFLLFSQYKISCIRFHEQF